ncbi:Arc family DNA-binding protein [Kitasatospora sp. NPDC058162]|uniref:Arc family DNA-binding protein n=1 Tax=Kitasatospora sp. NPDC058162 TaxID=3346362 RepID=UPI0036D86A77
MVSVYHYSCDMDHETRITLRLPADTHAWLTTQAKLNRRSLNSEIVHRLEVAHRATPPETPDRLDCDTATADPLRGKPESSPA